MDTSKDVFVLVDINDTSSLHIQKNSEETLINNNSHVCYVWLIINNNDLHHRWIYQNMYIGRFSLINNNNNDNKKNKNNSISYNIGSHLMIRKLLAQTVGEMW